jgi:phosphoribosylformylglycinamidine synthase II
MVVSVEEHGISPGAWREVALSDAEYDLIIEYLGRPPTPVELGMFGAMWSEHCGYKHSRPLLRRLPTEAPWVLQGPGENAGAIDVGDGLAVVFKVESHNHPSAIEPLQGAATGVGGIVRDIFTMGARPIALLDALRFGPLESQRNRYLFDHVVAGIGGYGNCLGVPTVGGELFFDRSFNGNPLVNAMCVGVAEHGSLMRAQASGPGNVVMAIGAKTGRDGLHGATFASVDDPESSHRGVVQVGNPFLEKLLMEACLELLSGDAVVAMQDLGAAGLTSSLVECASRGGVGAEIDVALVPRRETEMTAYEVMLSESQERMLLVVRPDAVAEVEAVVQRWSLDAAAIGLVTDDGRVRIKDGETTVADVPAHLFTEACPTYEPVAEESSEIARQRELALGGIPDLDQNSKSNDATSCLLRLLASPNVCSRRYVFEQYDHTILTNTVVSPGGGDAAVLRLKGTRRGLAVAIDCNSRYCLLDPELGARHAVAEATRNVACAGARSLAITNCLNFGSPNKPAGYYELSRAINGMAEACRALGVPVVSGNVSLYNETNGASVMPSPIVGAVGVLADVHRHATLAWRDGEEVYLLGGLSPTLGATEFLATIHNVTGGKPPCLDLDLERRVQEMIQAAIADGVVSAVHDCSDGGVVVALAEMAIAADLGVNVTALPDGATLRRDEALFGEAPSRIIVSLPSSRAGDLVQRCEGACIPHVKLGTAGGRRVAIANTIDVAIDAARTAYESALGGGS